MAADCQKGVVCLLFSERYNQQQEKVHEAMHLQKLQGLDPLEETNNVVIVGEQTGNIKTTKLPN